MKFKDVTNYSTTQSAEFDAGLRSYMLKVYNLMGLALLLTGGVAFLASQSTAYVNTVYGSPLQWVIMFAPLGIVFFLSARLHKLSTQAAQLWFWAFATVMGLSLSYIFLAYTGTSIARGFFITAATFGSMSLYGYTTKKDLSAWGKFLFMGVIGIIIAAVVNIFMQSSALQFAISVVTVLVFSGLTAYDTQKIKQEYYRYAGNLEIASKMAIMGALSLYIDFINIFVSMMHLFGEER